MNEQKAREILGTTIQPDNSLYCLGQYIAWHPDSKEATLDAEFTIEEITAISWWMNNKGKLT